MPRTQKPFWLTAWAPVAVQAGGFALLYFLSQHFVTIERFEAERKITSENASRNDAAHVELGKVLAEVVKAIAVMESNAKMIVALDDRQRTVISTVADHESRLKNLESRAVK
jgi:hypothetical protein